MTQYTVSSLQSAQHAVETVIAFGRAVESGDIKPHPETCFDIIVPAIETKERRFLGFRWTSTSRRQLLTITVTFKEGTPKTLVRGYGCDTIGLMEEIVGLTDGRLGRVESELVTTGKVYD